MDKHTEYLRRNLECAKACGTAANATTAIRRLRAMKRPPLWMLATMEGILERSKGLPKELAQWRNTAADAPAYVKSEAL